MGARAAGIGRSSGVRAARPGGGEAEQAPALVYDERADLSIEAWAALSRHADVFDAQGSLLR